MNATAISVPICIPADHPAFAGHFPGTPIVPGVVLLDALLEAVAGLLGAKIGQCVLQGVKFRSVVQPGETLTAKLEPSPGQVRFVLECAARIVASGTVTTVAVTGAQR